MAGWTDLFIYFNSGLFKGGCQLHPELPESLTFMTTDRGDWTQADVATIFGGQKQENEASVSSREVEMNKISSEESRGHGRKIDICYIEYNEMEENMQ